MHAVQYTQNVNTAVYTDCNQHNKKHGKNILKMRISRSYDNMIGNIKMSNEGFYQIYLIENNMCFSNQKTKLLCCADRNKTFISTFLIDHWNILIHPQYPTALHT